MWGPTGRIFSRSTAKLWMIVAMAAVSTAAVLIKLSSSHPLAIAFWRLLIVEIILIPFALRDLRRDFRLLRGSAPYLLIVGLALSMHFALWIWSFRFTTVASSVLLVTTHPLFVGGFSFWFLKERLNKWAILGMIGALLGSFVVIGGDLSLSGETLIGNLLALGGSLMFGAYLLAGSRYRKRFSLTSYVFIVYGSAAFFLLMGSLLLGIELVVDAPSEYLIFLALAIGPMLAGHTIFNWTLKYLSPTLISVSLLAEPVGASILAFVVLAELPGPGAVIGAPLVLAGIYLVAVNTSKI